MSSDRAAGALDRLPTIQTILRVLAHTTGLRVALVVHIGADDSWTAAAVLDEAGLGMRPGDQLQLETTY